MAKIDETTENNWLLKAGDLKPGEYISFNKIRVNYKDAVLALEKQYPGSSPPATNSIRSRLRISFHGSRVTVYFPDHQGRMDVDRCIWRDS